MRRRLMRANKLTKAEILKLPQFMKYKELNIGSVFRRKSPASVGLWIDNGEWGVEIRKLDSGTLVSWNKLHFHLHRRELIPSTIEEYNLAVGLYNKNPKLFDT